MQGNAREEISQRVLQRQTDDDAENCRGGDEAAQVYFLIDTIENQDEENRKIEQQPIDYPNAEKDEERQENQPGDSPNALEVMLPTRVAEDFEEDKAGES